MNSPRIVFMGTPEFAVTILSKLLQEKFNVVAVVTAPDRPAGRGRKINQSAVKQFALKNNLPVLQPTNLKSPSFFDELNYYKPELQIVVAFRMLPKIIWSLPKLGTFNLHASLLPNYRGAAPIHWAIINGETKTGVTTFFIDDKIDTGEIILQKETHILPNETVGSLHDKLMVLGADLVCKTVKLIAENTVSTIKQPERDTKLAPKLTSENTRIDWSLDTKTIYNKIRGLNPFPVAWTEIQNGDEILTTKLYEVHYDIINHDLVVGKILSTNKELKIATKDGFIKIDELKLAGKKKMDSKSLLNGLSFQPNAIAL